MSGNRYLVFMGQCIECGRQLKDGGVIGKSCAKKLHGPRPKKALSMVRVLYRLKQDANRLSIKVELDFNNSVATCVPLIHSPNTENVRAEMMEKIKYYMEAHKLYRSSTEEQLKMAGFDME